MSHEANRCKHPDVLKRTWPALTQDQRDAALVALGLACGDGDDLPQGPREKDWKDHEWNAMMSNGEHKHWQALPKARPPTPDGLIDGAQKKFGEAREARASAAAFKLGMFHYFQCASPAARLVPHGPGGPGC